MKKLIIGVFLSFFVLHLSAVGWTPTDGGLLVNLEQGDRFLLSVWLDLDKDGVEDPGEEYFVYNYNRVTRPDDIFHYSDGLYLKLFPQAADATEPSDMSIWSAGAPLDRSNIGGKDLSLDGLTYTIWNDGKTLKMNNDFQFLGALTDKYNDDKACDVVFIVPTDQESRTSFDPNRTLYNDRGRTDQAADGKIDGKTGKGLLGMTYREAYMLDVPRKNNPISYTNASLVTFNTTLETKKWSQNQITCEPGHAAYAFADDKHKPTTRTLFRLYMLDKPLNYCDSYFFATDEQDVKSYRKVNEPKNASDWTKPKKIYTWERKTPMKPVSKSSSPLYKTDYMYVPVSDSTYYYVGWNNDYRKDDETMGSGTAKSHFEKIRELPMKDLAGFEAPAGACGKMVVDTTSSEYNLDVRFEPAGYFLKVSTGKNVRMRKTGENEWTSEEMWHITDYYASLTIKTMLFSGPEFSEEDPGVDVEGWSIPVVGNTILVHGTEETCAGKSGWARIYTNDTDPNGHMEFILADSTLRIHYDNNGYLGVQIPDQYPADGESTVLVENGRLKEGFTFLGWNTKPDGSGDNYTPGTPINLATILADSVEVAGKRTLRLYAKATFDSEYNVAISFKHSDGKRYFLQHPGTAAPRYARARTYDNWTEVWQGMGNADNIDPEYLNTFTIRKDPPIRSGGPLAAGEKVLDPMHHTLRGYEDSLVFYENFAPALDEYLGLYYQTPNTILANNSWAGLFVAEKDSKIAWPDFKTPVVDNVTLKSTHYVEAGVLGDESTLDRKERSNSSAPYVQYSETNDQFDGVADVEKSTKFQLSAVVVADAHYVILPDTSEVWRDTIEFGYHENEQKREAVWSKLIGKQFMACMLIVEDDKIDTVYFHPNRDKIINDPNNLYLSPYFRVSMVFDLIRDSRVADPLPEGDSVMHEATDYHWHNEIVSGINSPMEVKDAEGNYIDIVDTFRITLSHGGISKIKEYRGIWNARDAHVKANAAGSSRYRDVIVRTKTYHYGDNQQRYVLKPEKESYNFGPLAGQTKPIRFILTQETYHKLLDKDGREKGEEIIQIDTLTKQLGMRLAGCSFTGNSFEASAAADSIVTLRVKEDNLLNINYDTLIISSINVNGVTTAVNVRVPLVQAALTTNELVWSVYDESSKKRYFVMAVNDGSSTSLQFREFTQVGSMLYKLGSKTPLVKGSNAGNNSDEKYITPWTSDYKEGDKTQLTLKTEYGINKYFAINGSNQGDLNDGKVLFTYRLAEVNTNANSNYEEKVRIKYSDGKWLKFNGGVSPSITLQDDSLTATVFSWGYLLTEYNLLNNNKYPSANEVSYGYNISAPKTIQTRYKAYREYSMLLDNELTYLCRKEETRIDSLTSAIREWRTTCTIDTIRDHRTATLSGLTNVTDNTTLTTTINATGVSPTNVTYRGKYIDIVDTLRVRLSLQDGAQNYRFKEDWSGFKSISDANLKIPLIRKTYHEGTFNTLSCLVEADDDNFTFPASITKDVNDKNEYNLRTILHEGTQMLDVDENVVAVTSERYIDVTKDRTDTTGMHLNNKQLAEVRLIDVYGNTPDWCEISDTTANTVTVKCTKNGIRSPRTAYLYMAYLVTINGTMRFVNYRLTVSQASSFEYANNQVLVHSSGASGDEKMENGMQQVHTNKRILYYYPDQNVELPVRERAFYGWWRWYREGVDVDSVDVSDTDIPDSLWRSAPRNAGKYTYPYRIIGDSVDDGAGGKKLVTMGRWTVFHYKSIDYNNKQDPPAKTPFVAPPDTMRVGVNRGKHPVVTYAVDISNYYDNLPMSLKDKNQIDAALMDTMRKIVEPTLSLREVFELHPWTEMADTLDHYRSSASDDIFPLAEEKYMEDHVMMAPTGAALLLQTEQRYRYENLKKYNHSESLLGYYMHDDNWGDMSPTKDASGWSRQDSMIWCGGWDADCLWYTYNPKTKQYTLCTHPVSEEEDFLKVPAKGAGAVDTVYYCLRARSRATTGTPNPDPKLSTETTVEGDYWFNICRYKIIYHSPDKYGPKIETTTKDGAKALITNEDIEYRYEVLERLNFDYIQPGSNYHVYPHPLPWADASYGYTYPETSALPHNRYHKESDFPNHGEYGLINRIPYSSYWHKMEQHGGAANGYMIYCDGMASAGQVAALTLESHLCAGQKMFFSGYVGNPSNQNPKKSCPNFIFSVQGSLDGITWYDITSYMTGDIQPSNKWYQIYFPILHNEDGRDYSHFRVRIYNVAANFDGNDFIIDDMCIFATKPPLIAYQAQTTCNDYGHSEEDTHVLLRIDYQGITGEGYNDTTVCYTVQQMTPDSVFSFVRMSDGYIDEHTTETGDTLYGKLFIPSKTYEPKDKDSVYKNMNDLLTRFDTTMAWRKKDGVTPIVREGYIYEILEGDIRPVKYIIHSAKMLSKNDYSVHMSGVPKELLSSICGMTSHLKISNRMVLELNGEEQPETEQLGLCANATYDISLIVKGSMYRDSVAPVDVEGSCVNDWLLYGDTARVSSKKRYGYYYSDIEKVVKDILRRVPVPSRENVNQFADNLAAVDSAVMRAVKEHYDVELDTTAHPYTILADMVNKGFLTLYQSQLTASVMSGDSLQYVIFPIEGSGSKEMEDARVEVCPNPILIKLKPDKGGGVPLMGGGLNRDSTELMLPVNVLATAVSANTEFKLRVDSIMRNVGIYSIELRSTDDPEFREGMHHLALEPDKNYPSDSYYIKGDSILLRPASTSNYTMRAGYNYTFNILMQTLLGQLKTDDGCEVGSVPFTVSVVPDYVRWNPQTAGNNNWNDANNWLGINANNEPIHDDAHFVPMENTYVLIPAMEPGKPYPVVQPLPSEHKDSIQKVGFQYNQCNTIRFLPGAAIGKQQYINTDVVVDMKLPNRKWAFRTSPVKGMIGGDLFTADAERNGTTPLWEVGAFDNSGRTYKTGYASYWLSVYNSANSHVNHSEEDSTRTVTADWSRVTNAMDHSLPAGRGFAVYVRTADSSDAVVRLPKNDDIYYYYGSYGERIDSKYEPNLQNLRNTLAGGVGMAGKMAYHPTADHDSITLRNVIPSNTFVFGNYTMGYIDIWGFISDNPSLNAKIGYLNEKGNASLYETVSLVAAEASGTDVITNTNRYLPPMHAMVLTTKGEEITELKLRLNTSRVVTDPSQVVAPSPSSAPRRMVSPRRKGIMRVTAKNATSARCTSHLLLGQGYHEEIVEGEDAVLTTINIDNYTANLTPTTPFNLYSVADGNGMCIDLRDSIVNVPVSFYMSDLEYEPTTQLWFTGVNNIDGPLVLYDEWTDSERRIIDGICLTIETPVQNHQKRYFIRRPGYRPQDPDAPIATRLEQFNTEDDQTVKFIQDGVVLILRNGHIYTMFGQKVR